MARAKLSPLAKLRKKLAAVSETPVAPDWLIAAAVNGTRPRRGVNAAIENLHRESQAVDRLAEALRRVPPAWPARSLESGLL